MAYLFTILIWSWMIFFHDNETNCRKFSSTSALKNYLFIACVLLLIAVAPMPYGYYQFIRIAITLVASINAFKLNNKNKSLLFVAFVSVIILYNPILTIHFSKSIWIPINLLTALFFGMFALLHKNKDVEIDGSQH